MTHRFSSEEVLNGEYSDDELKNGIIFKLDPRMYDFIEGRFVYLESTEDVDLKLKLLHNQNADFTFVVCTVGGGWPLIYSRYAVKIQAYDINSKQLRSFINASSNNVEFISDIRKGKIIFNYGDLMQVNQLTFEYSQATLIDLSNITDYFQPLKATKRLQEIYALMQFNSILIISSKYADKLKKFQNIFESVGAQVTIQLTKEHSDDDQVGHFMLIQKR